MLFPEVNRESALFLFLHIGDTGDVKEQLAETVLVNETRELVTSQTEREGDGQAVGVTDLQSFSSTGTSAVHQTWPIRRCTC